MSLHNLEALNALIPKIKNQNSLSPLVIKKHREKFKTALFELLTLPLYKDQNRIVWVDDKSIFYTEGEVLDNNVDTYQVLTAPVAHTILHIFGITEIFSDAIESITNFFIIIQET